MGGIMATPITTSIKFNGVTEITLTPTEAKDKVLLGLAVGGSTSVKNISVSEGGAVTFTLVPTESL
jgi:hypothetical protein